MNRAVEAPVKPQPTIRPASEPPVAMIDLDRFCDGCAYNLRTQPVWRDAGTGIPVVRCPECGRFQSANETSTALKPWLRRVTGLLLGLWILVLLSLFASLGLAKGALSYATLDELTRHGSYTVQRINNNTVTRTWRSSGALEIRPDVPDYEFFIGAVLAVSFLTAFAGGVLAVVLVPHWRRVAYAGLVLALPIVASSIVALAWSREAPHLFTWGLHYIAAHLGVQLVGGLGGITFGRPLARLAVAIFLPPGVRPRLAYLWLADGKALPKA